MTDFSMSDNLARDETPAFASIMTSVLISHIGCRDEATSKSFKVFTTLLFAIFSISIQANALPLDQIKLPPGFKIEVFAMVPNAREMTLGDKGTLFVGSMDAGNVYAMRTRNNKAIDVLTISSGLKLPVGVAFHDGSLYVSAVNRILRFDHIETNLKHPPPPVVVTEAFPSETHHGWKFIAFGPDNLLYVSVGAPCNNCEPDAVHGNISRIQVNAAKQTPEVVATGIRNSVGFDWDPQTKELWFTDNGRDEMGDDLPSDELNYAPRSGMNFGFPYCHAGDVSDPEFGYLHSCKEFIPPVAKLGPHVASLGMRFYTGHMFPREYLNNIFIAEHGSWNRSKKIGYRIARVVIADGKLVKQEVFAEGWLQGESAWGRPVDVLVMPDGALLVSDDYAGAIYRISYEK